MSEAVRYIIVILCAYLLGSVNCSIIVSRRRFHTDIREHGSGSAGMTNSLRTLGLRWTLPVIIGDLAKGFCAVFLGGALLGDYGRLLGGLCAIAGHIFPLYFGFRGGKGVLTALSIVLMVDWRVALICFSLFLVIVAIWRYVSLGAIIAVSFVPPVMWVFHPDDGKFLVTALALAGLIVFMHRGNIRRLLAHTEPKLTLKKGPSAKE